MAAPAVAVAMKTHPEYEVKAAYLVNFARYVTWPGESFDKPDDPIVICVLGQDPFGDYLDRTIAGKEINGHPLVAERLDRVEEAAGCHLVFVARSERYRETALLAALRGRPLLTVGESDRFVHDGGAINMSLSSDNRVQFEVNLDITSHAGLKVNSTMLSLAKAVHRTAAEVRE